MVSSWRRLTPAYPLEPSSGTRSVTRVSSAGSRPSSTACPTTRASADLVAEKPSSRSPAPGAAEVPLVDQDTVDHHHQRGRDGDGQELIQVHEPPRPGHGGPQRDRPGGPGARNGSGHLRVRLVALRLAQRV